jgi:hypothetical protein
MRSLFQSYQQIADEEIETLWANASFVLDANVLLNLYRYRQSTQDNLLGVLAKLSATNPVWLPHHVALEFHRNRCRVMATQIKRHNTLKEAVTNAADRFKTDVSKAALNGEQQILDPVPLLTQIEEVANEFLKKLDEQRKTIQEPWRPDSVKQRLDELFEGKVGNEPTADELRSYYEAGEIRFKANRPPGYKDTLKGDFGDEPPEYYHNSLSYQRKYGDLVIWLQLLEHARSQQWKTVIFVTDDRKEDWWEVVQADGPKMLGARPELIGEAAQYGIERLKLYTPERFLNSAKGYVKAEISDTAIAEVRRVSKEQAQTSGEGTIQSSDLAIAGHSKEGARWRWLSRRHPFAECEQISRDMFKVSEAAAPFEFAYVFVRVGRFSDPNLPISRAMVRLFDVANHFPRNRGKKLNTCVVFVFDADSLYSKQARRLREFLDTRQRPWAMALLTVLDRSTDGQPDLRDIISA